MPGVPPDAVEKLKGMLKGMFRRGKKNKTQTQSPPAQQQSGKSSAATTLPPPPPPPVNAAPAVTSTCTTTSPATDNAVNPLNNDKAQPAVPVEKPVEKISQAPATAGRPTSNIHAVSAASTTPAIPPAPSAAFESDPAPAVPPKNDGAGTIVKPTGTLTNHEDVSPLSVSPASTPAAAAEPVAPASVTNSAEANKPAITVPIIAHSDEKVPIESETNPIPAPSKSVTATNEMSATSGPLPDFPQGEAKE